MDFGIEIKNIYPKIAVVFVSGKIDKSTREDFLCHISLLIKEGKNRLIIDINNLEPIDESGYAYLRKTKEQVTRAKGAIVLVCANPENNPFSKKVRRFTNFACYKTEQEALEALR